jgi:hypothetical protein
MVRSMSSRREIPDRIVASNVPEDEMPGSACDLRGFEVAHFTDHDDVRRLVASSRPRK